MADEKGNLYLFEAVELRNEFDRHIKLLEHILDIDVDRTDRFLRSSEDETKEPSNDFHPKEIEEQLKKIQTKRVKLNQAIQAANFTNQLKYNGEEITIAEALEIRKNLLAELDSMTGKIKSSAYKQVIHKEERDIIKKSKHSFEEVYNEFKVKIIKLRELINLVHYANHTNIVKFKEE